MTRTNPQEQVFVGVETGFAKGGFVGGITAAVRAGEVPESGAATDVYVDGELTIQSLPWDVDDSRGYQLLGVIDGQVVGTATVTGRDQEALWLYQLFVADTHRRNGVASRLLEASVAIAQATGKDAISLSVRKNNTGARTLYRSQGFVTAVTYESTDRHDASVTMTRVVSVPVR